MSDPKQSPDPLDAPEPASMIPTMPGQAAAPSDPSDVDTGMPGTPAAPPMREAEPEDPAALARRLAAEAKARTKAASPPAEDPVALARRLAAEAKAKAKAKAVEDPAALARRLAAEAKAKAKASQVSQPAQNMAARRTKKRSAAEVLAEARRSEQAPVAPRPPAPAAPRPSAPAPTPAAPAASRPSLATPTPAPERTFDVDAVVLSALRGATVVRATRVTNAAAFTAVWRAHLARAQATNDIALAVAASALLAAADRVGAESIHAAEVRWAGAGTHAVWIDPRSQSLIATAFPAEVYLAGT